MYIMLNSKNYNKRIRIGCVDVDTCGIGEARNSVKHSVSRFVSTINSNLTRRNGQTV